ncbi:MAG: diaminobutyrate--2-oxoglutarate transaminase [Alphaproteobacteria bacterium 41-28]|nr:MAG: diaminobutyrate--2-oxoglutarate transaminase [Alphaproteobacteria bacterium 41-28]
MQNIFDKLESNVRSYCRKYPVVFTHSLGCILTASNSSQYIDFFCGAGSLNYGHNHPKIKQALINYLQENGIIHSLDMFTHAKENFLERFDKTILQPRNMEYKVQFCGPTGTNAIEAALKLAKKITGRSNIITFTNAFHGMSIGSLSVSGMRSQKEGGGLILSNAVFMPFDNYFGDGVNTIKYIERFLEDPESGVQAPAAFIVETIQGEGGVNVASEKWLVELQALAKRFNSLLIIDDVQVGCGRAGSFFSFEKYNVFPDIICLSKSLSGYGLPFSIVLIKPEHDVWAPGEHNGTFRGNNLAFVSSYETLSFWEDNTFILSMQEKILLVEKSLRKLVEESNLTIKLKGRGMIWGLEFEQENIAQEVAKICFKDGLLVETAGSRNQVIKLLPPLNIEDNYLQKGIRILENALEKFASYNYFPKSCMGSQAA